MPVLIPSKKRLLIAVIVFLCLVGVASALLRTYLTIDVLIDNVLPPADDINHGYATHPITTLMHVIPGILFMVCGPLQFLSRLRNKHPRIHRLSGYAFVLSSYFIGLSGLSIALWFPFGGLPETLVTVVFGSLFLICLSMGLRYAIQGQFQRHRHWMIRTFNLGLAVVTIRFLGPLVEAVTPDIPFSLVFAGSMLIGWTLHLAIAEWIIRRPTPRVLMRKTPDLETS